MLEGYARKGYYAIDPKEKKKGQDILWFIWENQNSPVFGKAKMTTFERYFIADKITHQDVYKRQVPDQGKRTVWSDHV